MADGSPVGDVTEVPVPDRLDFEIQAGGAQEGRERIRTDPAAALGEKTLAAPLNGDRHRVVSGARVEQPERPRVARPRRQRRLLVSRADQAVRHVLETTDGLVAVEESFDAPRETSGNGAARFHGTIDKTQRDVLRRQIRELADAPNAVDLLRQLVDVVDLDESYIEIDINALALPAGVHLFESLGHELFPRALPDHALLSSHHRVDGSVRLAGDVAVRQGIDGVAIRHETAD